MNLISLQLKTSSSFEKNFRKLEKQINKSPKKSFILASELFLSGYSYDRLQEAVKFTIKVTKSLKNLSLNKTIAITMTTKQDNKYFNTLHIFHKGKIVHTQSKAILFVLDDERKYFTAGNKKDIRIINIDGIKIAALICFELRFIELWKQVKGADIILVPAMWGKLRKEHYESLTKALAITNQCYVMASDSANSNMAKSSAIISPFGDVIKNDTKKVISSHYEAKEIKKMRRYINTGIK
ncbi:carbon-nitrogen hydrolase family protein [Arcobacteraceae bacterium]|nr:carbon-nitrogen hydrolase family protein [Arcobacteraceae bacterium]